jgi:hypothetical protein
MHGNRLDQLVSLNIRLGSSLDSIRNNLDLLGTLTTIQENRLDKLDAAVAQLQAFNVIQENHISAKETETATLHAELTKIMEAFNVIQENHISAKETETARNAQKDSESDIGEKLSVADAPERQSNNKHATSQDDQEAQEVNQAVYKNPTHYINCPVCQIQNWIPTRKFHGLSLNKCPVCKEVGIKDVVPLAICGHCVCRNCLNRQEAKLPIVRYALSIADWRDRYSEDSHEGLVCFVFEWWRYEDEMPTLDWSQIVNTLYMLSRDTSHRTHLYWWLGRKRHTFWSKTVTKNTVDRLDNILKKLVERNILHKLPPTYYYDDDDDVADRAYTSDKWKREESEEGSVKEDSGDTDEKED